MYGLRSVCLSFLLLPHLFAGAQSASAPPDSLKQQKQASVNPTLALGAGMFSYFGDISSVNYRHPVVSRLGYELSVTNALTPFLDLKFQVIFGTLGGNERSTTRNLNFQSEVRAGSASLLYNFHHLMPEIRRTEPWLSVGLSSFEFLSKTDLFDANGNRYYYWRDGSLMSLPENHPQAHTATNLQRDYIYESDIRALNLDGYGKYPERSFAVPLGAGIRFLLSPRVRFTLGSTMYFTFTDLIDGVTADGTGQRKGDARNDWFMMTSGSLSYDFMISKKTRSGGRELPPDYYDKIDFLAIENEDTDKDGVRDFDDRCAMTPQGVAVDMFGCPLDTDADGVPDFRDEEPATPAGVLVNDQGVQLTDSMIALMYEMYMDSTGKFARVINRSTEYSDLTRSGEPVNRRFMVQVGRFSKGIPPELINKFLSIPDIRTRSENDSVTLFLAGNFNDWHAANSRKNELREAGVEGEVVQERNGRVIAVPMPPYEPVAKTDTKGEVSQGSQSVTSAANQSNQTASALSDPENTTVFRVQLGAYRQQVPASNFPGSVNLVGVTSHDGLVKYLSGAYTSYQDAARHKVDMLLKGFGGAFVVAYRNGQRISLAEAGATPAGRDEDLDEEPVETWTPPKPRFRVQVGVFSATPPAEIEASLQTLPDIRRERTPGGLTRITSGNFSSYEEASAFRTRVVNEFGIEGAFVVAYQNDAMIPVQEALELLRK